MATSAVFALSAELAASICIDLGADRMLGRAESGGKNSTVIPARSSLRVAERKEKKSSVVICSETDVATTDAVSADCLIFLRDEWHDEMPVISSAMKKRIKDRIS